MHVLLQSMPPSLQQATTDPQLHRRLPETHRKSPVGSLFLYPGSWCTRFTCALQKSISQSYVNSGCSMVGLMVTSPKRTYAIVTARARPLPTSTSTGDTQTQFCLSLCAFPGSWCTQGLFEPSESL